MIAGTQRFTSSRARWSIVLLVYRYRLGLLERSLGKSMSECTNGMVQGASDFASRGRLVVSLL